jgi:ribosomal-protein-alanine N-acetyltransferase
MNTEIERLQLQSNAEWCASIMANSEPWITLRLTYEESLQIINDPSKEVYLVRLEGELSGFIILNMKSAFIETIYIAAKWRGKGLGSRLLRFAEERIFRESPNIFLFVSSFNPEAKRLYERLGYETIGELKDYMFRGHSEMLMRKTLIRAIEKIQKAILMQLCSSEAA